MAQSKSQSTQPEHVAEGEDAQEAGYWGTRDNPFPDEDFALTTGPDAPVTDDLGNPVDVEAAQQADEEVRKAGEDRDKEVQKSSQESRKQAEKH
jgi:hypothetical protein